MKIPVRFGPEWWACYGAAFALNFDKMLAALRAGGGDTDRLWLDEARDSLGSSVAEKAANVADRALECFQKAVNGESIKFGKTK